MTIPDFTALIALLGSAFALYITWRKAPAEITDLQTKAQQATADVLLKYMQALGTSGEQVRGLVERVRGLEETAKTQKCEIEELRKDNELLRDWATRLVYQVQSLGAVPVSFKPGEMNPISKE